VYLHTRELILDLFLYFNKTNELRYAPKHLSRLDIFEQVKGFNVTFGKPLEPMDTNKRARGKNVVKVVRAK